MLSTVMYDTPPKLLFNKHAWFQQLAYIYKQDGNSVDPNQLMPLLSSKFGSDSCADPDSFVRGGPTLTKFF